MKKIALLLTGILSVFLFAGCGRMQNKPPLGTESGTIVTAEDLIKENNELKRKIEQLESMNKGFASRVAELVKENNKLIQRNASYENYENYDRYITESRIANLRKEIRAIREELNRIDKDSYLNNLFNPGSLEAGDKVGSLTVNNVSITDSEAVYFNGSFIATGTLINDIANGGLSLIIKKIDNSLSMPYTFNELESGSIYFNISNYEDLIKQLGTEYKSGDDFEINITAEFADYIYLYKEETDMTSRASFKKLISINK